MFSRRNIRLFKLPGHQNIFSNFGPPLLLKPFRGLTEEHTQLGIISPVGYFKSPIGDILFNWGYVIYSLTLRYQTHISPIPNLIYYPQLGISDHQLGIIFPIGDIVF